MRWLPLLLLLAACPAWAQVAPAIPPGDDRIEHVTSGARAPYEGMLLDLDTAIRWTNRLTWWQQTYELRLRTDAEVLEATRASHATELRLVTESFEREIDHLRTSLREAVLRYEAELARYRSPPFYETWGFAFGVGALLMGAVVGLVGGLVVGL